MIKGIYYEITFIIMAVYYPGFSVQIGSPGSSDVFTGEGSYLLLGATGNSATQAASTLTGSGSGFQWRILCKSGTQSFWLVCTRPDPYFACMLVRPEGYTSTVTYQISTGSTPSRTYTFGGGPYSKKYVTESYIRDLWDDQLSSSTFLSDMDSFSSYEDCNLLRAIYTTGISSDAITKLVYGTGTTIWTSSQNIGNRYSAACNLGWKTNWTTVGAVYYTSPPAVNTGYTVTVNASTVNMTVNDEVQGYGTHSMRLIQVYAVTTGGTETLILAKPGATTVSFGLNTVSLGRQTTTVNGVKRFKMTFMVNGFNGVGATEFAVGGVGSDVYDYTDGDVEMYTDDLTSNITISSSGTVDLILSAGY